MTEWYLIFTRQIIIGEFLYYEYKNKNYLKPHLPVIRFTVMHQNEVFRGFFD